MALTKKGGTAGGTEGRGKSDYAATPRAGHRDAEVERRRARTLAKQQQVSERIAAATSQLASGINQAASAVEELKRSMEQIASGAEQASGASQESLQAVAQLLGELNGGFVADQNGVVDLTLGDELPHRVRAVDGDADELQSLLPEFLLQRHESRHFSQAGGYRVKPVSQYPGPGDGKNRPSGISDVGPVFMALVIIFTRIGGRRN